MEETIYIQGLHLTPSKLYLIRNLISDNPAWNRTTISRKICEIWNWRNAKGQIKDMACRTMLLKLERRDLIRLPPPNNGNGTGRSYRNLAVPELNTGSLQCPLKELLPLKIQRINEGCEANLFNYLLKNYHYLSLSKPVGENIKYLVKSASGRPLACILFGAAAWKVESRDKQIGWDRTSRAQNLPFVANQARFLILPWISVRNLASHLQSRISKRINSDWNEKYGHSIYLLETFVDISRFSGGCYRASNWKKAGVTKGRSRNDRHHSIATSQKAIWLYPLDKSYRTLLSGRTTG